MDIKNIQDLAKLADICRKKGIKQLKVDQNGIEFVLGDKPKNKRQAQDSQIETDSPAGDELLYWSAPSIGAQ